jgi:hypothetical protein
MGRPDEKLMTYSGVNGSRRKSTTKTPVTSAASSPPQAPPEGRRRQAAAPKYMVHYRDGRISYPSNVSVLLPSQPRVPAAEIMKREVGSI